MIEEQEGEDREQDSDSTGDPELDRQVADLEQKRDAVQSQIEETRSDWEAAKDDPAVPGAMADPDEQDDATDDTGTIEDDPVERDDDEVDEDDGGDDDDGDEDSDSDDDE